MRREYPEIESVDLAKNGLNQSGQPRTRKGWFAPALALDDDTDVVLPEDVPSLKKVSVNLPDDCVEFLNKMKGDTGMSPGKIFIEYLRADMNAYITSEIE